MGKRKQVIEKIEKKKELCKKGIVTTKIQQRPVAHRSDGLRQENGESSSRVTSLRQQAGVVTG